MYQVPWNIEQLIVWQRKKVFKKSICYQLFIVSLVSISTFSRVAYLLKNYFIPYMFHFYVHCIHHTKANSLYVETYLAINPILILILIVQII